MIRQSLFAAILFAVGPTITLAQDTTSATPPAASGQDAEIQRYVAFETAVALDDRCHYLRNLERARLYPVQEALLDELHFHQAYESSKISQEEYAAELDRLAGHGVEAASVIDCTDEAKASPLILPLRAEIAPTIYSDLLIAFEHGNLTAEQQNAARAFEAMIFPLYGQANWEGFVRYAAGEAGKRIEQARTDDTVDDTFGFSLFGGSSFGDDYFGQDDLPELLTVGSANFDGLVQNTVGTVNAILFEATAQQFGYRWIVKQARHSFASRSQLTDPIFKPVVDIWRQPEQYRTLDSDATFHAAFTLAPNGDVRVMTYGEGAAALAGGKVVVLVHEKLPEDMTDSFAYSRSAEWWTKAERFEGRPTDETCLGGPCFALPGEIIDAIDATGPGQTYRLFFMADSAAPDPAPDDLRITSGFGYAIAYRKEMIALGL